MVNAITAVAAVTIALAHQVHPALGWWMIGSWGALTFFISLCTSAPIDEHHP